MARIRHYYVGDWYGLYIDGKLVSETHNLEPWILFQELQRLGIDATSQYLGDAADESNLELSGGHMPDSEAELALLYFVPEDR